MTSPFAYNDGNWHFLTVVYTNSNVHVNTTGWLATTAASQRVGASRTRGCAQCSSASRASGPGSQLGYAHANSARGARASVHVCVLYGRSSHHKIESLFKAFARALRAACWRDRRMARLLPSTKGLL